MLSCCVVVRVNWGTLHNEQMVETFAEQAKAYWDEPMVRGVDCLSEEVYLLAPAELVEAAGL